MEPPANPDWMSSGGAYWVIGVAWVLIAAFYYGIAEMLGRATRTENDGCLMGIMNIVLTLVGGGVGILLFRNQYPIFVPASVVGALLFPTAGTLLVLGRMKKRRV